MTTTAASSDVRTQLQKAARALAASGTAHPRRRAAELWSGLFGMEPAAVWVSGDQPADPEQAAGFLAAVSRCAAGEPMQYVVGRAGFRTLWLEVDRRVLIPRPETEGLVERVIAWCHARSGDRWGTAADLGTGSGCIALSLAAEGKFSRIIATDVSVSAIAVAKRNAAAVDGGALLEFRVGSLLEPLGDEQVDVLVSNPPYLTPEEFARAERSVAAYEPELALVGGSDGLEHLCRLLDRGGDRLSIGGLLAVEVDSTRAAPALATARRTGWTDARIEEDLFGRPRYLLATKGVVT